MKPFEDELKQQLSVLGTLVDQQDALKVQIDDIRERVQQWMILNELQSYTVKDNYGFDWKINQSSYLKNSLDEEKLTAALGNLAPYKSQSTVNKFTCARVKEKAKKSTKTPKISKDQSGVPNAPTHNVN